jgi:glycosyltransferase involved in cell wall biosynthesis
MLSIIINVKNGEHHLARCLNSVVKFDDVVVLDNYSTDKTQLIAKKFANTKFFQCDFSGMGKVRNIALGYAKYDWVCFVDCDEILDAQLVDYLLNYKFSTTNHTYAILRKNYFNNRLINGCSWGNDWVNRIFNKHYNKYTEANMVHENLAQQNNIVKINHGHIIHFPYNNTEQLIEKLQRYSSLYAQQNIKRKKAKLYTIPFRTLLMFIKSYIFKNGWRFGFEGLAISYFNAMGVFAKYIKLYELQHSKDLGVIISSANISSELISKLNQQLYLPKIVIITVSQINDTTEIVTQLEALISEYVIIELQSKNREQLKQQFQLADILELNDMNLINEPSFLLRCRNKVKI